MRVYLYIHFAVILQVVEGFGNRVWDANGKEYLDATSGGTWTVNVGVHMYADISMYM